MSSNLPKISVIIPAFNAGKYLAKTLATVAKQEYKPYEVILVDGGSTDDTGDIVRAFGTLITFFVSEPDEGQLDAVRKGINIAKGDVLCWLNADDAVLPGAFRIVAEVFASDPSLDYVYGDNYWFCEETRKVGVVDSVKRLSFWDQFLFYGQLQVEAFFWKKEISQKALPFDTTLKVYTDYSFFLPLRYGSKGRWVPRRLGAFRVHCEQMSLVNRALGDEERERVKQNMRERLDLEHDEFIALQRKKYLGFLARHRLMPGIVSGFRFAGRKMTGDLMRKRIGRFFFDEWIQPPKSVVERLQREKYDYATASQNSSWENAG